MRNANEGVSLSEIVTKTTLRKFGIRGVNKYRLRYVENEHIVFDPVTGREVPAERTCINELVEALAMEATT